MIILIESTMMKLHLNVHLAFLHFGLLEKERKIRVKKIGRAEAILVYFDMSHMRRISDILFFQTGTVQSKICINVQLHYCILLVLNK